MMSEDFSPAPHQTAANRRMHAVKNNPLFFPMGCFKSSTVLYHCEDSGYSRVILCCLKDNLSGWVDQIEQHTKDSTYMVIKGTPKQKLKKLDDYIANDIKYLIINYEALQTDTLYQKLKKEAPLFDFITFDEAYSIHNHQRPKWKRWYNIRKKIDRSVILDGDPTAEGEIKLFGMFKMMDHGETFGTDYYRDFLNKYAKQDFFGNWKITPQGHIKIREKLQDVAMIINKKEVLPFLPPVVFETMYPEMTTTQKKQYKQMAKLFSVALDAKELEADSKMEQIHKLRQITGGFIYETKEDGERETIRLDNCKVEPLKKIMQQCDKLVIWCAYEEEMNIVKEVSEGLGRKSVIHKGNEKEHAKASFKVDRGVNDFISGIDGGIGLNELVVADTAVYYSRGDKRRSRSQSIARLDRPGQQGDKVTIIDIVVPETIDEGQFKRLKEKGERSKRLLNYSDNNAIKEAINGK